MAYKFFLCHDTQHHSNQHNNKAIVALSIMTLNDACCYPLCCNSALYVKCHYPEFHHAECCGTISDTLAKQARILSVFYGL
jgi:hypothetical protein